MMKLLTKKNHKRTEEDLKRLQEIEDQELALYKESQKIKNLCPCYDTSLKMIETLAFDITPAEVCIVCSKPKQTALTLKQKIACFKEYFDFGGDYDSPSYYSEEKILEIVKAGGLNF